jgi:PAS domain S-box-containing protein
VLAQALTWAAAMALVLGLGTWFCLRLWDRQVRREEGQAMRLLTARRAAAHRQAEAEAATAERNRALAEAWAIVLWRAGADGGLIDAEGWPALTGQPLAAALGRGWLDRIHPEDRGRAAEAWEAGVASGGSIDVDYRVGTADGLWRWCRARGVPIGSAMAQAPGRLEWVGVLEDIDERRRAEELRLLVSREVDHRAKNVLAVVQTIVKLSAANDPRNYAASVWARIAALARAHDLLAERGWIGVDLRVMAEREFAAYRAAGQITLRGEPLALAAIAVQPLAMVLHELATNAARHGALSAPEGRVTLSWHRDGPLLRLAWVETGGPPADLPPLHQGLGTRMIDSTVRGQLGGLLERRWRREGLVCEIALPLARVSAAVGATEELSQRAS